MLERRTSNPGCAGSNPAGGATKSPWLQGIGYLLDQATNAIERPETPGFGSMSGPREAPWR